MTRVSLHSFPQVSQFLPRCTVERIQTLESNKWGRRPSLTASDLCGLGQVCDINLRSLLHACFMPTIGPTIRFCYMTMPWCSGDLESSPMFLLFKMPLERLCIHMGS
jgi:hypothetical protein